MFKQTQHVAADMAKTSSIKPQYERIYSNIVDNSRFRHRDISKANLENCSNQRFNQIKRKYGMQDKLVLQQTDIKPLREINLNTSNSFIFKDKQQNYKSRSSTVFKSSFLNPLNLRQNTRQDFRQSIVRKVDYQKDIPRFGGRTNWEGISSKSIQIPHEERVGSIDKITMKIHQALNLNIDNKKLKQDEKKILNIQNPNNNYFASKIKTQTQDNGRNIVHEVRQSRRIQSIDDKMKRFSMNFSILQDKRSKTPHLLEQSKRQDSLRHRNFDDQIKRIQQKIKKSHEQKKRLDITLPQRQNYRLPKRVLDYTKQQKPLAFMQRRNRIMSNNIQSIKLKTQYNQNHIDLPVTKEYNRLNTEYSNFDLASQKYNDFKYKNYEKQNTTRRSYDQKTELNKLVQALKMQVQLDQKLRNAKVTSSSNHIQNKWGTIKQLLQKQKIFFSQSKVQSEFQISQQQHNPFFSVRQSNKSFDQVIGRYSQSYKHWTTNIFQKFNLMSLINQGFCEKSIDLTKKGQISIEDLVRFLNFQTKNFYRNRDLFLIWRRITTKSSLHFEELTNNICHK